MVRRLWEHRALLVSFARRQFQLRYRQSFAGIAWAIVPPLVTLGMATLVFHRVAKIDTGEIPYSLFAFSALVPWTFLASSLIGGLGSIAGSQAMITRLAFPRAVLPLSMIGVSLIDLAIATGTFVLFVYVTGEGLPITALWFPVLLVIEIVLISGVVLLGSALNIFARDFRVAFPLLAQAWLFLTPVMYPLSAVPDHLQDVYMLNPMTGLVESFRGVLVSGNAPDIGLLGPSIIGAVLLFAIGWWYFGATEHRMADVI
ncbi:MAG: ABC transporter permease [Actinomycetota bacterium]